MAKASNKGSSSKGNSKPAKPPPTKGGKSFSNGNAKTRMTPAEKRRMLRDL